MRIILAGTFAIALLLCGCAGYRLGPTGGQTAGARSVQITPFLNHSLEPGLADELTESVRKSVQQDGTFRLATHGDSDLILEGVIINYRRREVSLSDDDVRTVQDYQVSMGVQVSIRERYTGRVVADREVRGSTLLRVGDNLASAERQAAPVLAKDLARQITALLVDGAW